MAVTEWHFYTELAPKLDIPLPKVDQAGQLPCGCSYLLMEDLQDEHKILLEGHPWTNVELRSVLSTYALLHGRSLRLFEGGPIPDWLHQDDRHRFSPAQVSACLRQFHDNSWTRDAVGPILRPGLESLLDQVTSGLGSQPPSVLFNDFCPPNVALPHDLGPAKLFDWQLVGAGLLHVDVVNIGFLSRQDALTQAEQRDLLDHYLDRLADQVGLRYDTEQFLHLYRLASLLAWGVFMPRIVGAMQRANAQGKQFDLWMEKAFRNCIMEWVEALDQVF